MPLETCGDSTRAVRTNATRVTSYKFALPRRDMKVVKDNATVAPGLALGSWLAFKKMGNEARVMGASF